MKLRNLKGYKIPARSFAEDFRKGFEKDKENWENVGINYGPLTLMEGWIELKPDCIRNDLHILAHKFLSISSIIDSVLNNYRLKS